MKRRSFLQLAAGASLAPELLIAAEHPYLKVGFMTDTHVGVTRKSCERVKGAFEVFKAWGVDAIGHLGDLADWHYDEGYKFYREAFETVYADPAMRPMLLYSYANHDALDPKRKDPKLRATRMMDLKTAFAAMRQKLAIEHDLFHEVELKGVPFLVFPQTFSLIGGYEFAEKRIAEACRRHPSGPVVVMTHHVPQHTCYNSGEWGDARLRKMLDKFPQVISFGGHTHGSLRNEQSVWQGAFTAVDCCCLQEWHGVSVGTSVQGKQAYGVIVAEFFADRIVLRRVDVRDGNEFKPNDPWMVALPHSAAKAKLAWSERAKTERRAAFVEGAVLEFAVDAVPFSSVKVKFSGVKHEEDVMCYRVEIHRHREGRWERFARGDLFGEFYLRPQDRRGTYARDFASAYFEPGANYRFTVTPVGFFGAESAPLVGEWTAPAAVKYERAYLCEDPMKELRLKQGWPRSQTDRDSMKFAMREGDWWVLGGGCLWMDLPAGTWQAKVGTKFRVSVDLRLKQQPGIDGACLRLSTPDGTARSACGWMTTPDGESGLLRFVFEFTARQDPLPDYAVQLDRAHDGLVRIERILVERK